MEAFLYELSKSVQGNLTFEEVLLLISAGAVSMYGRRKWKTLPFLYSIFLIVYITLLRRSPGYQEEIQLHLQLWANAGTLAGNVWNVLLYLPFGWTAAKVWEKMDWIGIMLTGVGLSCLCEFLQFWTARGTADLNDILSNGIGAATGAIAVCWLDRKERTNREQKP